jgi:hypothetical protein
VQWLAISIVLSIVLTVVLNVALRVFPGAGDQLGRKLTELAAERPEGGVYVPWKAMIVASLVLTVGLNLLLRVLW